jgi:hypothetical protein
MAGGYTNNHTRFNEQKEIWARKASTVGNIKDVVAVKVFMGRIKPGQTKVTIIDVRISVSNPLITVLIL